MRPSPRRRAALLGGALIAALPGLALAQSVADPDDQPTAGTLPPDTSTLPRQDPAGRPTGEVRAPSPIRPSTSVVPYGRATRTNPLDHLSERYRSNREN